MITDDNDSEWTDFVDQVYFWEPVWIDGWKSGRKGEDAAHNVFADSVKALVWYNAHKAARDSLPH